jgi:hypothetical protein
MHVVERIRGEVAKPPGDQHEQVAGIALEPAARPDRERGAGRTLLEREHDVDRLEVLAAFTRRGSSGSEKRSTISPPGATHSSPSCAIAARSSSAGPTPGTGSTKGGSPPAGSSPRTSYSARSGAASGSPPAPRTASREGKPASASTTRPPGGYPPSSRVADATGFGVNVTRSPSASSVPAAFRPSPCATLTESSVTELGSIGSSNTIVSERLSASGPSPGRGESITTLGPDLVSPQPLARANAAISGIGNDVIAIATARRGAAPPLTTRLAAADSPHATPAPQATDTTPRSRAG